MASSGSFNTSKYDVRYLTFSWSVSSQSVANNTTTISWSLKGAGGSTTSWYTSGNFKVVIDGTTVYSSSTRIKLYNGTTVASGTYTMTHNNSTGAKSFTASAQAGIYYVAVNCTGSGTWDLPTIPRYATSNQTLNSKTETTIKMNWSSDNTCDYIWYSTNNGSSWTGVNVSDGTSGSYTISGLSANTTYNVKTRVRRKDSQLTTDSSALSVTTYNYPYATTMPNFTIGNAVTISFYNPLGRSISVVGYASNGTTQIFAGSTTGTSLTGFNDSGSVATQYASIPSSTSGTYKVKVTYSSSSITKTGGTYSINTSACTPTIGTCSYYDANSTVTAITGNNQNIVRNQSQVTFTAASLTAKNSASISSCSVSVNNNSYSMTISSSTATKTGVVIDSASDVTATFTVTDSRGLTASKSITVNMLDWVLPSAIITLQRENNYYSDTYLTVDANYSSLDSLNTITIQARYKKVTDSTWSSYITLSDNVQTTLSLDNLYEWNVQVLLTDLFGSTTYNLVVQKGMPILYVDRLLNSVGINCFPVDDESLEVNGVNLERNVMTMSLSTTITNLAVSTYTIIPLDLSESAGSKLTATSGGGIQIGSNVSKVLVSGRMLIGTDNISGNRHLRIVKNSYSNDNTLAWTFEPIDASSQDNMTITPTLASVDSGDIIYLMYYTADTDDDINGGSFGSRTSLTVEVIE